MWPRLHGPCDCQGSRHPLLETMPNCLNCGYILCVKQRAPACPFCGGSSDPPHASTNEEAQTRAQALNAKLVHAATAMTIEDEATQLWDDFEPCRWKTLAEYEAAKREAAAAKHRHRQEQTRVPLSFTARK